MVKKRRNKKLKQKQTVILVLLSMVLIFSGIAIYAVYNNVFKDNTVHMQEIKEDQIDSHSFDTITHNVSFVDVKADLKKAKKVNQGQKVVALTFDDGPGYASTQRILDCLAKYNIKATFFCLGSKAEQNPEMLKKIADAGHEVANHSYNHPNLVTLDDASVADQINKTNNIIENIIGEKPSALRPPYGSYDNRVSSIAQMDIAMWNVDSNDWRSRNGDAIYTHVMSTIRPVSTILFHDIYDFTADGVEKVVAKLIEDGYTFVTYSEISQYEGI